MIAVKIVGLRICFFVMISFPIFCLGIFVFCFIEKIKVEEPKSPVSRGSRGWFIGRFKVDIPRKPAKRKMINARILDWCSFEIRKIAEVWGETFVFGRDDLVVEILAEKILNLRMYNN